MIRSYLSAGILLHAISVMELLVVFIICISMDSHSTQYAVLTLACVLTVFTQLDARSRFQEFKRVRDQLNCFGPNKRIFKSVSNSRCQRAAALAAARQLGFGNDCADYFHKAGYRWHHLLPDFVKSHPDFFLSLHFWRSTFFAPTYHARYHIRSSVVVSHLAPSVIDL
jgi:hypothetical protein